MRFLIILFLAAIGFAADWPRFRGPNGSGVSDGRGLPVEFGKDKNLVWKADVPGGTSCPIVAADRVYLTGFEKDERFVLAYDLKTGKELWRKAYTKVRSETAHPLNGPATPTPVIDGKNLYVFFPEIGLLSLDRDGNPRWKTELGPFQSVQGLAASPVLAAGLVILPIDQARDSYIAAFDAKTGKQRWKVERASSLLGGYTTPLVYKPKGGPEQVIFAGSFEITGYQASTGERLWWLNGFTTAPAASPVLIGDVLYTNEPAGQDYDAPFSMWDNTDKNKDGKLSREEIANPGLIRLLLGIDEDFGNKDGFLEASEWTRFNASARESGGNLAILLGGKGDLTKSALRWRILKSVPYLTGNVVYENVLYSVRDGGILTAIDPANGEILKQGRIEGAIDKYYASPVAGDGKVYFTSENGKISVVKAGAQWETLQVNDLEEPTYAAPALTDGRILIRTRKGLYCFGKPL